MASSRAENNITTVPNSFNSNKRTMAPNLDLQLQNLSDSRLTGNQMDSFHHQDEARAHNSTVAPSENSNSIPGVAMLNQGETKTYTNRLVQNNQNSYLNNSSVKTATHKRRNISIGAERVGLDTAQQNHNRNKNTIDS